MNTAPKTNDPKNADVSEDIQQAQTVIKTEIAGMEQLSGFIDENFSSAVSAINQMKCEKSSGRLIVAGIGKSGHIARKIAATLASTGTPAYFVHPGEASHGDLGMITEHDVVLMLSNSGENNELSDLIHYTRRFGICLIAITSNKSSTLASHADINLFIPKAREACPNGLAPTTSTTMMMALGDALAVALLNRMSLTAEQFKTFHPGGKLGQKLLKVSDLMVPFSDISTLSIKAKMDEAILGLTEKNLGTVIVINENDEMAGIITDGDLKRHMDENLLKKSVEDIMSTSPKTIKPGSLAVEAMDIMTRTKGQYITSLIVLETGTTIPLGLIRLQDCLQAGLA